MRLYYHPFSANARRALMTALYLGVPIELELVDMTKGEHRHPSYLGKNPAGRVPVLDDDGFLLPESHAIMIYLAEKTPGQTVYPTDLRERAEVNRWMFWCSHHFMPAISVLNWENMVKPMIGLGAPDPVELKRGEKLVIEHAGVLDAHLAGREWIAGSSLTLADLSVAASLMTTTVAKLPVLQFGNLQAWFQRMQGLDVWKKTVPPAPGAKAA